MNRGRAIALAVVSLLVAACGGASLPPAGGATPSAGASVATLPAGQHTSAVFQPAVTFTTPTDGWVLFEDTPSYLNLGPVEGGDIVGIHLFRDPQPLSQAADCPVAAQPGVSVTNSITFLAWVKSVKGLSVTTPAMATIGGLPASSVDVSIKADWTASCPFAGGTPTVPLLYGPANGLRWVVAGDERLRLYVVDLPKGGFVVVDVDAFVGTEMDGLLTNAAPIIKSMTFAAN